MRVTLITLAAVACSTTQALAATHCVEKFLLEHSTTHDAIQAALDAAQPGDTVDFNCFGPAPIYPVGKFDGSAVSLVGKHGVIYEGSGATLKLVDQPANAPWTLWRQAKILRIPGTSGEDFDAIREMVTDVDSLHLDMNRGNQNPKDEPDESKQMGLFLGVPASVLAAGEQHPVQVTHSSCRNSTWGCFTVHDHADVHLNEIGTENNHHAIQIVPPSEARVYIVHLYSVDDDFGVKIETNGIDTRLDVSIHKSVLKGKGEGIAWGVRHREAASAPQTNALTLDGVSAQVLFANLFDTVLAVSGSAFTRNNSTYSVSLGYIERAVTIRDSNTAGHLYMTDTTPGYSNAITLEDVVFDGIGWPAGSMNYAIQTTRSLGGTEREIALLNVGAYCCASCPCSNALINLDGGTAYVDSDTVMNWEDDTTVVRAGWRADAGYTTEVRDNSGVLVDTATVGRVSWCGDQDPSSATDFQCTQ